MVRREAIMEREKRRRTNIKGETSNDASRSIKDNVSSYQNQLKEKKKPRKSDNDDDDDKHGENDENKDVIDDDEKGSEENSTKLSN